MKKTVFIVSLILIFFVLITFTAYFEKKEKEIKKIYNTKKEEIALKTLRNSILLLNFYQPVEVYLDYPINANDFSNFYNIKVKFCKNYTFHKKFSLYYNKEKNCIEKI